MIKPYKGRIVLVLDAPKDLGFLVPKQIKRKQNIGKVFDIASGSEYNVGERVLFHPTKGQFFTVLGEKRALIMEEDIVLILNKDGMKQIKGDRVCVEKIMLDKVLESGIVMPDMVKGDSGRGIVKWIGESDDAKSYSVGDEVMYNLSSGNEVEVSGKEYLILGCKDILAIL